MSEQPTYNQIHEQYQQQGDSAAVLLPRRDGTIVTGRFEGTYDEEGMAVINYVAEDGTRMQKSAKSEIVLSDEFQRKLAADLGGMALLSSNELPDLRDTPADRDEQANASKSDSVPLPPLNDDTYEQPNPVSVDTLPPLDGPEPAQQQTSVGQELPPLNDTPAETIETHNEQSGMNSQEAVMQELQHDWKLPEGATVETAEQKLDAALNAVHELQARLTPNGDFNHATSRLYEAYGNSMQYDQLTVGDGEINDAQQQLQLVKHGFDVLESVGVLSPMIRREIAESRAYVQRLVGSLDESRPQNGRYDTDKLRHAYIQVAPDNVEGLRARVAGFEQQLIEKRAGLNGYERDAGSHEQQVEQFASEYIRDMATELRKDTTSERDVAAATASLRRLIEDAIANGSEYPDLVMRNVSKTRKVGQKMGTEGESRQVVAEMAIDMLARRFNMSVVPDPILVNAKNMAVEGQHRAAALMTVYGKNWIQAAKTAGFKIETIR